MSLVSPFVSLSAATNSVGSQNSDVYVGYCGWAAGGFDQTYTLAETPKVSGSTLTDNELVAQVLAPKKST